MSEPREFKVPEGCLFESTDASFEQYPDDAVTFMVSRYEYDLLKLEADKLAEALERVQRDLFESSLDTRNFVCRETIDQALKDYYGE